MNSAVKAAIFNPQNHVISLRAALFHSTPVLERKRRSHWHTPHWQEDINDDDPSSSRGTSWFKKDYGRSKQTRYQGHHGGGRRGAWINEELDEDEGFVDIEHVFESLFGRGQRSHWSFTYEDNTGRRSSYSYGYNYWDHQNWRSRDRQNWRFRVEEDYEFEEESEGSESDMASDRQALGLRASGPLKLEDVKLAYRACALKWHPDRHQGSSKAVAEEKFKLCSAAYQSLCDKLAVD
ncbi:hypothetical protein AB3S75_032539 [Citrus x aurantiifolia]